MKKSLVAGIDIGGTNIEIGLVNQQGEILYRKSFQTVKFLTVEDLVNDIAEEINNFFSTHSPFLLEGIGIGAPNGNIFKGTIDHAPNLPWKGEIPLADLFSKKMEVDVKLNNDANAATIGEMIFGAAKGCKDFIFITLGTGLGSGIVCNGQLVYGHGGHAGEVGHMILVPDGRMCGCGRKGCVETYCSATAIQQTYAEITNLQLSSKEIYLQAKGGVDNAILAFKKTGEWLGLALANAVAVTEPEKIILFGGLAQAGEILLQPTIQSFEKNALFIYQNKIPIIYSSLPQNEAAVLGAASLIWANNQ